MMNFDALDFSECRSEERISFFWGSVYILLIGSRNTNTLPRRGEDVITPAGVIILPFAGTFGLHFNDSKHIFLTSSPTIRWYRNLPANYGLPLDGRAMQAKVLLSSPQKCPHLTPKTFSRQQYSFSLSNTCICMCNLWTVIVRNVEFLYVQYPSASTLSLKALFNNFSL